MTNLSGSPSMRGSRSSNWEETEVNKSDPWVLAITHDRLSAAQILHPLTPVRQSPKLPIRDISLLLSTAPTRQLDVSHRRASSYLVPLHEPRLSGLGHDFAYPQIFGKRNSHVKSPRLWARRASGWLVTMLLQGNQHGE